MSFLAVSKSMPASRDRVYRVGVALVTLALLAVLALPLLKASGRASRW